MRSQIMLTVLCGAAIEGQTGHLRAQTRALHAYLRWRNANARHPDVLDAQRKERARVRSEKGFRWGGRPVSEAA